MTVNNPDKTYESTSTQTASSAPSTGAPSLSGKDADSLAASTTAKLASAAHAAVDVAATKLEKAEHALREGHPVQKVSDTALSLSQTLEDALKAYIHQYPIRSVGIALATGFLLSAATKK